MNQAKLATRYLKFLLLFWGALPPSGNWAVAADRPSALGAMGLGGTLVGSADRRGSRSAGLANAGRLSFAAYRQQQRGDYLDERRRRAEHYFEMRRMNESYRAEMRRPSPTPEELAAFNESRLPQRLTPVQWQPAIGEIRWPSQLLGEEHASARAQLELLFAARTPDDSGVSGSGYGEVRRLTRRMRDELSRQAREMSVEEYSLARKFLESLAYEARFSMEAGK